jgi:hypothetical protein
MLMWTAATTDVFDEWFQTLGDEERAEIEAKVNLLELFGPALGRPTPTHSTDRRTPT